MINKIQEALKHEEHAMGVFLDIQGAFDNIPIKSIKRALNKTAAKGMVADWIINMISNRKIELKWGNSKINRKIEKGCPQGGVLSPFLWNLVLDDLLQKFNNSDNIQAFADDLSLLSIGKTQYGIINNTRNIINKIMKWCKENGLQISTLKTKVIYWSKTKNKNHPKHIQIDGQKIEISKSVKYLGVIIDNKLNWNEHIQTTVNKCKKAYSLQKEPSAINGEYHQNK